MDGEKIKRCHQLWKTAELARQLLDKISEDSEDTVALDRFTHSFQTLQGDLSTELSERIVYLFSGAEIEPEDLRGAGKQIWEEVSAAIGKTLVEQLSSCPHIERSAAAKLFPLWDKMPHLNADAYQWMLDLCEKTSVSMPLESFQYTLKEFEERPDLLSGADAPHPGYYYKPSEQRTFERCPTCGGTGKPYFRSLSYLMADFSYPHLPAKLWMKCRRCGGLYTWKYPEELLRTAGDEGTLSPDPARALTAVEGTSGMILGIWSDILGRLSSYCGGKTLLEVGVGKGELLAVALELGYRPDAVEIVPSAAQKTADMLGIPVWCGDFLNYSSNKRYSVITMGDVIEHVTDPKRALQNAHRLLEPNGVLWLSTPNYESAFSRMLKFQDPMWKEPYHISYFNRRGLESLAAECGFILREYSISKRYNGSMELILTKAPSIQEGGT